MADKRPWFRLWSEAVDDEKLRLLAFEDRWHFVAILCCKAQGLLEADNEPSMLARKVAVKLGLQARELDEVARRLSEVGLIDKDDFQPTHWDSRQFAGDVSTERVRKYRAAKRDETLLKRCRNVSETPPETETETETENYSPGVPGESPTSAKRDPQRDACPYTKIRTLWMEILPELRRPIDVEHWTPARKAQIRARWADQLPDLEAWAECFHLVRTSKFLMGQSSPTNSRKPFQCDLFWLSKPENLLKLYEGKYG